MMVKFNHDITLTAGAVYRIQSDQNGMVELCELTRNAPAGREWTVVASGPELGLPYPPSAQGVVIYPHDRASLEK